MCGFIAQLVEQRTGNAEVTGSNPVEALIFFFQASSFQLLKFTAMIILRFHLQPQFKYELFHILHIKTFLLKLFSQNTKNGVSGEACCVTSPLGAHSLYLDANTSFF